MYHTTFDLQIGYKLVLYDVRVLIGHHWSSVVSSFMMIVTLFSFGEATYQLGNSGESELNGLFRCNLLPMQPIN